MKKVQNGFHHTHWLSALKKEEAKLRIEAVKIAKEKGGKTGIKKGEKIGIEKNKLEMAKQMKMKGYSLNDIMELTGLTKTDIEQL
ncbi:MAG: hypothetical protein PHW82_11210 [Bacteroidales bacterium]|nr:hypothetical protein [Bacteroidales bacterium]